MICIMTDTEGKVYIEFDYDFTNSALNTLSFKVYI